MEKVNKLLQSIALVIKADDDELKDLIENFPEVDQLMKYVEKYEKKIAKLLKAQKKHFIDKVESLVAKDENDITVLALLQMLMSEFFETDDFEQDMTEASQSFFNESVSTLVASIMDMIDKDIQFEILSQRTLDWIESWSADLASLMKLSSHEAIETIFAESIEAGEGIPKIVSKLKELPEFDRARARKTAITEVLTASSVSQHEAYTQSPAVTGKTWLHSGSRKNSPRPHHVDLSGTTIAMDEKFDVGGHAADYPRDTSLPAKERVYCHCALSPSVDENILGLTKEEKEEIRRSVLSAR